jgi:hypothetical protein
MLCLYCCAPLELTVSKIIQSELFEFAEAVCPVCGVEYVIYDSKDRNKFRTQVIIKEGGGKLL